MRGEDGGEGRAARRRRTHRPRDFVVHGLRSLRGCWRVGSSSSSARELRAGRRQALVGVAVGVEHLARCRAPGRGAPCRCSELMSANRLLRQARALHAFLHQLLAGLGEVADLDGGVDDRHQQRAGDQRQAQQHQSGQRFGSRPPHVAASLATRVRAADAFPNRAKCARWCRCRRVSASSSSTWRTFSALATSAGGSPARRGSSRMSSLTPGDLLHAREHFAHAVAVAVTAVRDERFAAGAQVVERVQVRGGEIFDVDVVAHTGAVGRREVGAEDRQVRAFAHGRFDRRLDQQRGLARRLADAALRVGAGDVEITQHHVSACGVTAHRSRSIHSDISFEVP